MTALELCAAETLHDECARCVDLIEPAADFAKLAGLPSVTLTEHGPDPEHAVTVWLEEATR